MTEINQVQDEIIDEFADLDDWMDRYAYIIEMGNALESLDESLKTPDNLIEGCQSRLWLDAQYSDGVVTYRADSDAIIVKGIVAMLIRVLSGQAPQDIVDADLYFIERIGLRDHLSPTRSNGLLSMLKQMRAYAMAFNSIHNS
ncbi:MAG: SufE family protein [Muribaculaceae bacterium]|nr:SufE family protein [Muribaculaceae bacterium]